MIAIALLAIVACASAAPHYHHDHHHHHHNDFHNNDDFSLDKFMSGSVFDTSSFWGQMRKEMMGLTAMIEELRQHFPTGIREEKIEGNEYKITISLTGFTDKEIAVKARKGLLIVEAVHKVDGEPERSYLDLRTLPDVVNVNGSWTYENGLLKIVFPLVQKSEVEPVTEAPVTQATEDRRESEEIDIRSPGTQNAPEHSHEVVETEQKGTNNQNADVGIVGGVTNEGNSVSANEIPQGQNVEATTYAVDLKGEVELLPINYY